jgi:esterase/lipase
MKKYLIYPLISIFLFSFGSLFKNEAVALQFIFEDVQYSFQAIRAIDKASSGGADIGECLKTLYRIKEGDDEGWYREWYKTAEDREKTADKFLAAGHKISAKQEYFRASNYYRTAEFFLHTNPKDPRIITTWRKSRDCFQSGARLSNTPIKPVEIPFEGTTLPGYLCLVDNSGRKRPLLIIHTGFDGTGEEVYFDVAYYALQRGYNCLIFEGPGQGRVIREQGIPFRHNWETVITPVVDFAIKQPVVDTKNIALMGISFGGYLAPRAVAFEHRIKICIANGGVYEFPGINRPDEKGYQQLGNQEHARNYDEEVYAEMKKNPSLRWAVSNGMFTFKAKSPSEWLKMTKPYTLKDVAEKIKCRMLIVDSEEDKDLPGQAKKLYDALTCPKEFMLFTKEDGAEEHCQVGAHLISNERILDWLDNAMRISK